jgi:hypothetical protein
VNMSRSRQEAGPGGQGGLRAPRRRTGTAWHLLFKIGSRLARWSLGLIAKRWMVLLPKG